MRNALATVPKLAQQMVAATLRTVFAQPDAASAHETVERICRLFEKRYPSLVACLKEAETDILAYYGFPAEHRKQIWSTNSLERLNKEVSRRCDVVGIFPNRPARLRLVGAVLEEQNDEWAVGRRYFSTESMNKLTQPTNEEVVRALLELESA
jgi:putative transposase